MWIDAAPMRKMRSVVRAMLPTNAMLKRDRGDALLITNVAVDALPGFTLAHRGTLTRIYPDASWVHRFERRFSEPVDDFSASLARFKGIEPDHEAILLFTRGAKLLDSSTETEREQYDTAVRRYAAKVLREGEPGGGLYALAVLDNFLKT